MEDKEKLKRWRLILGQDSEERFAGMGAEGLDEEQQIMDMALAAIYNRQEQGGFVNGGGAGRGPSNPLISRWLGDVRSLFDKDIVTIIQTDAVNRCGLSGDEIFAGKSQLVSPIGERIDSCGVQEEAILYGSVDLNRIAKERDFNTVLTDRHPEDYRPIWDTPYKEES